jgi:hypothetical protein
MDDELIQACATAARLACRRMTPPYLKAMDDRVEQARGLPAGFEWDRKATVHAEIVNLLAAVTRSCSSGACGDTSVRVPAA